jgi:AhpD family alkylhydroperoxidase
MQARIENPAVLLPDAVKGVNLLSKAATSSGVDPKVLGLVHMRASQINGCSVCVDMGWRGAEQHGETTERLFAVAAWRETPYFTDAERAALALAESVTRLADSSDPVPDHIWDAAAKHFNDSQLAGIVLWIAMTNLFNRMNAATRQMAPQSWG